VDEATWGDKRIVREDEPTTGVDVTPGRDEVAAGGELGFGAGAELGSWAGAELGFGAGAELGSGAGAGLGFGAAGDGAGGASGEFAGGAAAEVGMVGHNGESPKDRKGGYLGKIRKKRGAGARITSARLCQTKGVWQCHGSASVQSPNPRKDVGLRPTSMTINP
jgi:hypothetical protein